MEFFAQVGRLLDPVALAIVFGGALVAALLRGGRSAFGPAFAALGPFFRADPEADALAAMVCVGKVEKLAETRGIVCADRVATAGRFVREAIRRLADAPSSESFTRWARESLDARARRHATRIAFWRDLADAAPAMGMCATVLGLVRMFAHMTDPALIGAPMATALVATLWGIVLANLVAGPVSDRLERLSEAELAWQRRTLDHFSSLARGELDHAQGLQRVLQRNYGT
ncbi:MAG TPA: MotA/TolQ/ExbB proton channel family protein [Sphingomonas sp.]|nr:MotA/TolQ/ExbB proton channel family protein [Sphingomonas sp.]